MNDQNKLENTCQTLRKPAFIKTWWVAIRPFALPASTMPVIFGSVLAATYGGAKFDWILFVSALFAIAFLHTGANLLNDISDYKKGVDVSVNPVSGAIVRGWITTRQAGFAAFVFLLMGCSIGLWLFSVVGLPILWIGITGVAIGVLYSIGSTGLKYYALGDVVVFFNFGILGSLGAWTVQTGYLSLTPVVWAIPMSILVTGILHANNWRDIKSDTKSNVRTMANLFGDRISEYYFYFLMFAPFAIIIAIIAVSKFANTVPHMPVTFLITLLGLPLAFKLMKKGRMRFKSKNPLEFLALDGATAQLNLVFGLLCTLALGLNVLVA